MSLQGMLAAIPFRAAPAVGAGQVIWVVVVTIALLAIAFFVLVRARRKGWLDRWLAQPATRVAGTARQSWAIESQRINRNIVVHTLERQGQTLVLVESRSGVSVTALPAGPQSSTEVGT